MRTGIFSVRRKYQDTNLVGKTPVFRLRTNISPNIRGNEPPAFLGQIAILIFQQMGIFSTHAKTRGLRGGEVPKNRPPPVPEKISQLAGVCK